MGREVPFETDAICDGCGATGAYDFMGDNLCEVCCAAFFPDDAEVVGEPLQSSPHGNSGRNN